jgi:hypothetical protein
VLLIVAARSIEFVNIASSLVYAIVSPFVFVALTVYYVSRRRELIARESDADMPRVGATA